MFELADRHAAMTDYFIKGQIGLRFRSTVNVRVRKPVWMPERVYRWLMRTIIVETGPLVVEHVDV